MISPIFVELFGGIVERKISKWVEDGKRAKVKTIHNRPLPHIEIPDKEMWDNKDEVILCCFVDFISV